MLGMSSGVTLKAQSPDTDFHKVEFGLRFMPTLSSFNMESSSGGNVSGQATFGFGMAAVLGVNFSNHVGIQTEVVYNSLSQKFQDQTIDRKINVRYINIPLMISLNTGKSKKVNFNMVCGPQLGVNLGSDISSTGGPVSDTVTTVFAANKADLGLAYGAGIEIMLNEARTLRLDLGFRGVYGLLNISNTSQTQANNSYYVLDRANIRTKSGYVGVSFLF